ncbi:MAG: hypothetical protein JO110_02270 [Acetobacteraceae bacterium]|nr:hypothetical protein [Acetobacteraceae bacterium]
MQENRTAPLGMHLAIPELLEFSGEFGAEINSFIPFVYWLHLAGQMRDRRIRTYLGMRPFYFFLHPTQIQEKSDLRRYVAPLQRPDWLPTRDDHRSQRNGFEVFPDYRTRYRNTLFESHKPLLVVHNKFTREWYGPPINFLSLPMLETIAQGLADKFTIIYTRPGIKSRQEGFSGDQQNDYVLDDLSLVRRISSVLLFEDIVSTMAGDLSYNELKLMLYASSYFHITVQGGNAHLAALFSGSLIGVLHHFGQEIAHSYQHGHFQYAANPRPDYLICRSEDELMLALDVFGGSSLAAGRAVIPADAADAVTALSAEAQCGPGRMDPVIAP